MPTYGFTDILYFIVVPTRKHNQGMRGKKLLKNAVMNNEWSQFNISGNYA